MSEPKFFYLVTLGCPKNFVDTEIIAGTLSTAGFILTGDPEEADLYLINSCAFIPAARAEALEAIAEGEAWKEARPGRRLAVAGCLIEWDKERRFPKEHPLVDLWTGVNQVPEIARLLEKGGTPPAEKPVYLYNECTPRLQLTLPHLAYLKIADGCDNCCTYCAIPGIRGGLRSRTIDSVLKEAANLVNAGVRELVLIAQDVTAFGLDRPESGETLTKLLKELEKLEGNFVIRLLYTHPAHYTDELIDFLAGSRKVLPYLDIPLQHISERILTAMNRRVSRQAVETLLGKLRERIPGLVLRTTFITGFPGETEAEFAELEAFLKAARFERCGVFPFSPEPGTAAAKLPGQIPTEEAEARATQLMKVQTGIMKRYAKSLIGKELRVLIDGFDGNCAIARGVMDAPEIDNVIFLPEPSKRLRAGEFYRARIEGLDRCDLVGEIIKEKGKRG